MGLRNFLDEQKKHFTGEGKLKRLFPLFEAAESFILSSGNITKKAPFIRDFMDIKRVMITVVIALIPCVIMALYNTGYQVNSLLAETGTSSIDRWRSSLLSSLGTGLNPHSIIDCMVHGALYFLPVLIITFLDGGLWEAIFAIVRKQEISEGFLVTGLLFPLTLPPDIPLWQAALGISFGVVIGKEIFGGTGRNIFNPALTGRVFLFFAYPAQISGDSVWVPIDGVTKATPLAEIADQSTSLTFSWTEAFIGTIPGSMGETSALACLIGAALLLVTGIASWRIMLSTVAGLLMLSSLLFLTGSTSNPMLALSPLWHLVLGGFAFGTVYMTTDPVTGAMTEKGQYLYGLLIGILTVLIRSVNPAFPEGIMLAILFANMFAPIIDRVFINANIRRRRERSA